MIVGVAGLEPTTSRSQGARSSQTEPNPDNKTLCLQYKPKYTLKINLLYVSFIILYKYYIIIFLFCQEIFKVFFIGAKSSLLSITIPRISLHLGQTKGT